MKKEIELSKDYLMLLQLQFVKNESKDKLRYEVKSKIVNKEEYRKDENCIGEREFFKAIPVHIPRTPFLKKQYENRLKNKISRTINQFIKYSKTVVEELELYNDIDEYIDNLILAKK